MRVSVCAKVLVKLYLDLSHFIFIRTHEKLLFLKKKVPLIIV